MVAVIISKLGLSEPYIKSLLVEYQLKPDSFDILVIPKGEKHSLKLAGKIRDFFAMRPQTGSSKAAVIEADEMTVLEQNALLKTAEELPDECVLIFVSSNEGVFLPTLLSRSRVYNSVGDVQDDFGEIEKFITSSQKDRLEIIEKIKDKSEFLVDLIGYYQRRLLNTDTSQIQSVAIFLNQALEAFLWSKHNVNIRGILELLSLKSPTIAPELRQKHSA